ncbi:FAS1-like dehydratase domain-containing protein [Niveispirillum sp. KHB5.9]|uniref:FAS1-like dehydratase domain-containing protein n=1 Tax=Niveispirillum sp. KHB5.9 TaxID=3400269 RepID=UPI003A8B15F7
MTSTVDPTELEQWRGWIGRSEARTETLDAEALRRYAAALGEDLDVERRQPSLAHWAFFLPVVAADRIGPDGHPMRGGFLPPVSLSRRMFGAAAMEFGDALVLGKAATLTATIADVRHKPGRSGDLVFVEVDREIAQDGVVKVRERQTIVYRPAGVPVAPIEETRLRVGEVDRVWRPGPVELFRFSAVTFNSHRIHYDLPYAMDEEGYPGLVVHGPFTAARLYGLAAEQAGAPLRRFGFRAAAPLFANQPILLSPGAEPGFVQAVRCDGTVAMTATAAS